MKYVEEVMNDHFTKHLLFFENFHAVLHHFTSTDNENPHSHPYSFTSHILKGGYIEEIFYPQLDGTWHSEIISRPSGTTHTVDATTIHRITNLPEGECWTIITPHEKVQESKFWRFNKDGYSSRFWYEEEFK